MRRDEATTQLEDDNLDPLTGAPGAHPLGAGIGATGGGLAGAAIGAVGGPIGAGIGIVAGAIAGGLAGKAAAESIDPTAEDAYWRDNFESRPYVVKGDVYDKFRPAYRTGYENRARYQGRTFDEVEPDLRLDYEQRESDMALSWERAKEAARDAWQRVDDTLPGNDDRNK